MDRRFSPPWAQQNWEDRRNTHSHGHHGPHGHRHGWHTASPEQLALRSTAREVARLFAIASHSSSENAEKQAHFRAFLEQSRKELSDIISETTQNVSPETAPGIEQA
jgi:hypothetical protein